MRLNWNNRREPGDFDETAPKVVTYDFDHRRAMTGDSWPKGFGPASINKAWKHGLVVVAQIEGFPWPVAVTESAWKEGVLMVRTLEGYKVADRIYTRDTVKGLSCTGELTEGE